MLMHAQDSDADAPRTDVLITAEEAYPAMERAFLNARTEIWASYRVFDLSTALRSAEARAVGEDWFDLVVHTLKRGVAIHMVLSDFDPILGETLHGMAWKGKRAFIAAAELAGSDPRLTITAAVHSARVGMLPRLLLWPRIYRELRALAETYNDLTPEERDTRLETRPGLAQWLKRDGNNRLVPKKWPVPPLFPATHHQKVAVFDRCLLCIGGLDLDERRYDDKGHHRRRDKTWHDVQLMHRGPEAADAQRHLETFLTTVDGQSDPPPPDKRLLTTLSRRRRLHLAYLGPKPVRSTLAQGHHDQIAHAKRLIYLETQFFRDRQLADALAQAARRNPELSLILVLPGAPEDVAFDGNTGSDARFGEYQQARAIETVSAAFGSRAAICSPVRPTCAESTGRDTLCGAPIVYVHAKVSIFDDARAIVSSANLNARSLSWDTEAGILLDDPNTVAHLRYRVFAHWLGGTAPQDFLDPGKAVKAWSHRARSNATRHPEDRHGFLVPHDPAPARRMGRRLPVPDAFV